MAGITNQIPQGTPYGCNSLGTLNDARFTEFVLVRKRPAG